MKNIKHNILVKIFTIQRLIIVKNVQNNHKKTSNTIKNANFNIKMLYIFCNNDMMRTYQINTK